MTSLQMQMLSSAEVIEMKRARGLMSCAECQRRRLRCDRKIPCSSCVRRGKADICPSGESQTTPRGRRQTRDKPSTHLTLVLRTMSDRISQLERAIAVAHNDSSTDGELHPLLRDPELLKIKQFDAEDDGSESSRERPDKETEKEDLQLGESFGALAISSGGKGEPRYYGPTGGVSAFLSSQSSSDHHPSFNPFDTMTFGFPFLRIQRYSHTYLTPAWDRVYALDALILQYLPDRTRAASVLDVYERILSWHCAAISPQDAHTLMDTVYCYRDYLQGAGRVSTSNGKLARVDGRSLGILFFVLALASLADIDGLPAYSAEADTLFDAGRAALVIEFSQSSALGGRKTGPGTHADVLFDPDFAELAGNDPERVERGIKTVQAFALMGIYHATGGRQYSDNASWVMVSFAVASAKKLRLHRESTYTNLEHDVAQTRKTIFWELFTFETYQSLASSRPLSISPDEITCSYPEDLQITKGSDGRTVPGWLRLKYRFTHEVSATIAHSYSCVQNRSYEDVMGMDKRLRKFIETSRADCEHYQSNLRFDKDPTTYRAYIESRILPRFYGNIMQSIHRHAFVQALSRPPSQNSSTGPHDPLSTPYAASYLAAYRGASLVIKHDVRSFELYGEQFNRWWVVWKSLINAAFTVGSLVAKCPTSPIAPLALRELYAATHIVERGAAHTKELSISMGGGPEGMGAAAGSLGILRRLRNTATFIFCSVHAPSVSNPRSRVNLHLPEIQMQLSGNELLADEADFLALSGLGPIVGADERASAATEISEAVNTPGKQRQAQQPLAAPQEVYDYYVPSHAHAQESPDGSWETTEIGLAMDHEPWNALDVMMQEYHPRAVYPQVYGDELAMYSGPGYTWAQGSHWPEPKQLEDAGNFGPAGRWVQFVEGL
ncbi:Zn(2)-C6 fungal-type domain-containing protein [Mycena indigotica]|uniref:Zn(2)-C6 fungal-type domain-containing protein n=1 Tax=Mycena indigotica TaxID=2126181 RepID=A0A8H6S3V6_9AGAR|nr:Zn(2)-C6 fungal-type domain-containing protein [Mycena indigotica]KAF7291357.1 Zn(2)-C6 fungal-type domain-containing protein [Mycena indigotica]